MTLYGLHWLDAMILIAYVVVVVVLGQVFSRRVKNEGDFFLGGRCSENGSSFFSTSAT